MNYCMHHILPLLKYHLTKEINLLFYRAYQKEGGVAPFKYSVGKKYYGPTGSSTPQISFYKNYKVKTL